MRRPLTQRVGRGALWLLAGLALGFGLALLIGWVLFPVEYYDTAPASLRADYKDDYLRIVALAYQVEGDLARARRRLAALNSETPTQPLIDLTERWIAEERAEWLILPLIHLARDMGATTPAMRPYLQRRTP
jgi:hypothetical protein